MSHPSGSPAGWWSDPLYADDLTAIHRLGDWHPDQVRSVWRPSTLRHDAEQRTAIAAAWDAACARPGVHLFDGRLCRLEDLTVHDDGWAIGLSPTGYRAFLGSNCTHPEWADRHGHAALADALGTSVALLSSDGWAVFGRRSPHLALYPGHPHPVGGTLEVADGPAPDTTAELLREVREEVGLAADEIRTVRVLALTEDRRFRQPEMVWLVATACTRIDLERRIARDEHTGAWSVRAAADALRQELLPLRDMTPVLRAVLLVLGWRLGGRRWLDAISRP